MARIKKNFCPRLPSLVFSQKQNTSVGENNSSYSGSSAGHYIERFSLEVWEPVDICSYNHFQTPKYDRGKNSVTEEEVKFLRWFVLKMLTDLFKEIWWRCHCARVSQIMLPLESVHLVI